MEFASAGPSKFDIHKPPDPYPESSQDRDGNFSGPDEKDFSQKSDGHENADTDSSKYSKHHTLGTKSGQASPGNHIHDGTTSKKLGQGLGLAISGSRGGNVAVASIIAMLSNIIDFTDNTTP